MTEDEYQQGLTCLRKANFAEALQHFKAARKLYQGDPDIDLLFNLGLCHWKCGQLTPAKTILQRVVMLDPKDLNAQAILQRIQAALVVEEAALKTVLPAVYLPIAPPVKVPDSVILDANILIKVCKFDPLKFVKTFGKMRRHYTLYISASVFSELLPLEKGTPHYDDIQRLLKEGITITDIPPSAIQTLSQRVLTSCENGDAIRDLHGNRQQAWENDLSLVCLLLQVDAPIKYIVTNDRGIQKMVRSLFPTLDEQYYLRSLNDFLSAVDLMMQTGEKPVWEQRLYETGGK